MKIIWDCEKLVKVNRIEDRFQNYNWAYIGQWCIMLPWRCVDSSVSTDNLYEKN